MEKMFSEADIMRYQQYLLEAEKSRATIAKYLRDIRCFHRFLELQQRFSREDVLAFKAYLIGHYKPASVNSMLIAVNGFLGWIGLECYRVKGLRVQRQLFCMAEKELSSAEYMRLLRAAREQGNERLSLIMQTVCATGIRISELPFITVASLQSCQAVVNGKNKYRIVLLPGKLIRVLKQYVREQGIKSGSIFVTRSGKPLNRSYIWSEMKKLCRPAAVAAGKVYPHNLRHLFARTYYKQQRDIVRLADILGHSSIETARIYTVSTGSEQKFQLESLGLVMTEQ